MIYSFYIETPANTSELAPLVTELKISRGIIHQVFIGFPPGLQAECHLTLWREGHQVWPSSPDQDFAWEDYTFPFIEWLPIETEPYMMWAHTWNDNPDYDYPILVILCILPREVLEGKREELGILKRIERLVRGER